MKNHPAHGILEQRPDKREAMLTEHVEQFRCQHTRLVYQRVLIPLKSAADWVAETVDGLHEGQAFDVMIQKIMGEDTWHEVREYEWFVSIIKTFYELHGHVVP